MKINAIVVTFDKKLIDEGPEDYEVHENVKGADYAEVDKTPLSDVVQKVFAITPTAGSPLKVSATDVYNSLWPDIQDRLTQAITILQTASTGSKFDTFELDKALGTSYFTDWVIEVVDVDCYDYYHIDEWAMRSLKHDRGSDLYVLGNFRVRQ